MAESMTERLCVLLTASSNVSYVPYPAIVDVSRLSKEIKQRPRLVAVASDRRNTVHVFCYFCVAVVVSILILSSLCCVFFRCLLVMEPRW